MYKRKYIREYCEIVEIVKKYNEISEGGGRQTADSTSRERAEHSAGVKKSSFSSETNTFGDAIDTSFRLSPER